MPGNPGPSRVRSGWRGPSLDTSALRAADDLDDAFVWKEERPLSQALTLQYDKMILILEPSEPAKAAIGKYVTIFDYPDGRLAIRHNGVQLAYRTFDKVRQVNQGAIADNKHLGAVLAMIRDEQLRRRPSIPAGRADAISATRVFTRSAELIYRRSGVNAVPWSWWALSCAGSPEGATSRMDTSTEPAVKQHRAT